MCKSWHVPLVYEAGLWLHLVVLTKYAGVEEDVTPGAAEEQIQMDG